MSRFPRRHASELHRRRIRNAWASFWLSLALLGALAGGLALQSLCREPETRAFTGFWVAEEQGEKAPLPRPLPPLPQEPAPQLSLPQAVAECLPAEAEEVPELELPAVVDMPLPEEESAAPPAPRRARTAAAVPAVPAAAAPAAPAAAAVRRSEGEFIPPAYLSAPKPPYPAGMRQSRLEGTVKLRISIDTQGAPMRVEVLEGSGHTEFDSTARLWVLEHWMFKPARRGESAIPGTVVTRVHFVLN